MADKNSERASGLLFAFAMSLCYAGMLFRVAIPLGNSGMTFFVPAKESFEEKQQWF